jgi:hypothetical protein
MTTITAGAQAQRSTRKTRITPMTLGGQDPRPLTSYTVAVTTVSGNTRVTVTLAQPCIIGTPHWAFITQDNGSRVYANLVTVVSNTQFYFQFAGAMNPAISSVEPPYQDPQVRNFLGGFVVPGAKWFQVPTLS